MLCMPLICILVVSIVTDFEPTEAVNLDYFIDLVFYNYILKCFLLIDLKTERITHQDVGQMDMYVRMYDNLKRTEGDNPTIGLILCSETSEDMARYSVLRDNERLFQARYLTYLPSIDQLREEIEQQIEIFRLQQECVNIEWWLGVK